MSAPPALVPDDAEVIPPKSRRAKAIAKKLSASARDHSSRKATAHTGLPRESWRKASRYKKKVHRHLPGKYHSMSNVAAILLGRVDLRVDRQQFRNHMKIQDSLSAVIHVSLSRSGTGRHGGRPSQMQQS